MRTQRRIEKTILSTDSRRFEEEDAVDQVEQTTGTGGAVPEASRKKSEVKTDTEAINAWSLLLTTEEMKRMSRYLLRTRGRTRTHYDQPDGLWIVDLSISTEPELVRMPATSRIYR